MEGQPQRETIVSRPCFCKITNIRRMDKISREFQVEKVFFGSSLEVLIEGRFYKLVSMEGRVSILLGCLHASRNASCGFSFSCAARYAAFRKTYGAKTANTSQAKL